MRNQLRLFTHLFSRKSNESVLLIWVAGNYELFGVEGVEAVEEVDAFETVEMVGEVEMVKRVGYSISGSRLCREFGLAPGFCR